MKRKKKPALSHVDARGNVRMVDVSAKGVTVRRAVATAEVRMNAKTLKLLLARQLPKGDAIATARIAGIQAAKQTSSLIPLCHSLPLDAVDIRIEPRLPTRLLIRAETRVRARTGVEMEALTAAAVAALAVYDLCKAVDRGIEIGPLRLEEKSGGRSGTWRRGARRVPGRKA